MSGGSPCDWFSISPRKWDRCYDVMHYRNGFGLFDSVCYGLWLARG